MFEENAKWHPKPVKHTDLRSTLQDLLLKFEPFIGVVVLTNCVFLCVEADLHAQNVKDMPTWLKVSNTIFIVFYAVEVVSRLYVERCAFFRSFSNIFDFVIVVLGIVGEIIEGALDSVSVLRCVRLLKMLRMIRVFGAFRELWRLIRDLLDCLRTLMWAFALIALTLTMWSIFAVELIHPLMADLAEEGIYDSCGWCAGAFSSVLLADLTFFQIMSGDGWGTIARPVIERHPWTAIIFVGVIFTMSLGLLNVLIAVMCENAAAGRIADTSMMATIREEEKQTAKKRMVKLCEEIDKDQSGNISLAELQEASKDLPDFANLLRVMDIEPDDIECVFSILDEDRSGEVSYHEFAEQLWRMKMQEAHTAMMLTKYYVLQIYTKLQVDFRQQSMDLAADVHLMRDEFQERLETTQDDLAEVLALLLPFDVPNKKSRRGVGATEMRYSVLMKAQDVRAQKDYHEVVAEKSRNRSISGNDRACTRTPTHECGQQSPAAVKSGKPVIDGRAELSLPSTIIPVNSSLKPQFSQSTLSSGEFAATPSANGAPEHDFLEYGTKSTI